MAEDDEICADCQQPLDEHCDECGECECTGDHCDECGDSDCDGECAIEDTDDEIGDKN